MTTNAAAGLDWAKDEHALCILDEAGRKLFEGRFAHDERGISELCRSLVAHHVQAVAIERPEGVLVEGLLAAGLLVRFHPNQLKAARPRFRAAGSKSDGFDAFSSLAELARTDRHRFRALLPDSDETKALKALTRAREDLVEEERVALANSGARPPPPPPSSKPKPGGRSSCWWWPRCARWWSE